MESVGQCPLHLALQTFAPLTSVFPTLTPAAQTLSVL